MDRELLYAAAMSGGQVPMECHMFSGDFSVREVEFCMTFWMLDTGQQPCASSW